MILNINNNSIANKIKNIISNSNSNLKFYKLLVIYFINKN